MNTLSKISSETKTQNLSFEERIEAFVQLGKQLRSDNEQWKNEIEQMAVEQYVQNQWFIPSFGQFALQAIGEMLQADALSSLLTRYRESINDSYKIVAPLTVGVISAGNIPLAGFHDFFAVLVTGHRYLGKLSRNDCYLLPKIADMLVKIAPTLAQQIDFTDRLTHFDAVIATGSNNSARYFEYYFGKYPHITRKSRNSVAVLTGKESQSELEGLFLDTFLYFGLGCRSVSLLCVPKNYDFQPFLNICQQLGKELSQHHHYLNNLDYQRTLFLMNRTPFVDGGIALFTENAQLCSPISVVHTHTYNHIDEIVSFIAQEHEHLQCVVATAGLIDNTISFGKAQIPAVTDFADGVDTIAWGISLFQNQ
ncbi:MAG: hypothetical protein LBR51_06360 [Bacteroidales bacterium]|jgi:hypothetical protein|nr:hypothetical protein [Bacteroidales bacterium]